MTVQEELQKTEALLAIIKAHSGRERVELTDSLDDLGLDSLEFVALIQNIEHDFGIEIPMKDYAEIETVRDLLMLRLKPCAICVRDLRERI